MKSRNLITLVSGWLALATATAIPANAADPLAPTGTIQGRVEHAASGNYLGNVRVSVEGVAQEALTNSFGEYRLESVPQGARTVRAAIVGYTTKSAAITVTVEPVTANFSLSRGTPGPTASSDANRAVVLDTFVVASQREMSGSSVAINERRAAMNLKNVIASDEFGDSAEGNVAEYVKYLPGLAIDYNNADARSVSVRGLPAFGTAVMIDGNRLASAADGFSRGTEFNAVSLNNLAYIEVSKSPLPDTPADTIGGSINMVLKSAFERSRPVFNYKTNLNGNFSRASGSSLIRLGKIPASRGDVSTVKPGFDLNYVNPVSKNFGFTFSLLNSNQYSPAAMASPSWRPVSSGSALASADQPFLGSFAISDRPRQGFRWSTGLTLDWRVTPRDVLSLGGQWNRFETILDYSDIAFDTVATAVRPTAFDATMTQGALGAGRVTRGVTTFHKFFLGQNASLSYRHNGPVWTLASGTSYSRSKTFVVSAEDGVIKTMSLRSPNVTVRYDGIAESIPGRISTTTATGAPYAFGDLGSYTLLNMTQGNPQNYLAITTSGFANAARWFKLAVPVKLKTGFDVRREERATTNPGSTLTFVGPDRVAASADDVASRYDLIADDYSGVNVPFGVGRIQRPSVKKAYALLQAHPEYFTENEATTHQTGATRSMEFTESVVSGYLRADVALFENRLKLAGGFRYEHTYDTGNGLRNDPNAIYQKNPAGKLLLDAAGRPIRIAGSALDLAKLQYTERGSRGKRDYGNVFPSLNSAYSLTEKILLRSSFALTIARPQLNSVVPSTTVTDPASTAIPTITVNNPGLKPWSSQSYDVAVEYYFDKPGLISVGVFRKDIKNFFGGVRTKATPELLAEYGFDDSFLSYDISTRENVGSAKVTGVEVDYRQTLTGLPTWARGLAVLANATALRVQGDARADFSGFIGRSANWGLSLSRPRFTAKLNWSYRGRQRQGAVTGANVPAGTYAFASPRLSTDVNFEFRLTKHATLFANVRNLTDIAWRSEVHSPTTPYYARITNASEFGPQAILGIKGTF